MSHLSLPVHSYCSDPGETRPVYTSLTMGKREGGERVMEGDGVGRERREGEKIA